MNEQPDEFLTITQAKDYLGVSEYKIKRLFYGDVERQLPPAFPSIPNPYRITSRLVKRRDLDAYLAGVPRRTKKDPQPPDESGHESRPRR